MSNTYHISAYARRRHSRIIQPCHVDIGPTMCGGIIPQAVVAALNAANFCELVTDGDAPPTNTFQFPGPCKSGLLLQR